MRSNRWELAELLTLGAIALSIKLATTLVEMVVARATGAVPLRYDALHNLGDLFLFAVAWGAWLVARRPATAAHPWGFGRVEELAQVVVGLAIAATGVYVLMEALELMTQGSPAPEREHLIVVALTTVGVMGAYSVAAKLQHLAGRRTGSTLLSAAGDDAIADILVAAMAGIVALLRGLGAPSGLDVLAGIVIGVLILRLAWRTTWPALLRLTDRQDFGLQQQIAALLRRQHGVIAVEQVRARRLGSTGADVAVLVRVMRWAPPAAHLQHEIVQALAGEGRRATVAVQLCPAPPYNATPPTVWVRSRGATPNAAPQSAWQHTHNQRPAAW